MRNSLARALGLLDTAGPHLVSFVGGGGKTSLIFALAAQLPGKVIITTTTRLARAQVDGAAPRLSATICRFPDLSALDEAAEGIFLVIGVDVADEKVSGVAPDQPRRWLSRGDITAVLVEADGARMRPVKAPAEYEPVLPIGTTLLVPVAGVDALGQRIGEVAHRAPLVAGLLGKSQEAVLTPRDLALLLTAPQGGLKSVPVSARVIPVLNKVQTPEQMTAARQAAREILRSPLPHCALLTAAATANPLLERVSRVTAVVLAAGEARRMGRLKQLLPWGDTTMLGQTLRTLSHTVVHDTLVVTGAEADAVAAVVTAGVPTLHNPDYARSEMLGSLQTAVRQLPAQIEAALVVLADQPLVEPQTIDLLLQALWQGRGDLIAPSYDGRRGNPVLIGRAYFQELLSLPTGAAPRDLLRRHELFLVPVQSPSVLQDIDDLQDYESLRPG